MNELERPRRLSGDQPIYSREALAARVSGKMAARCMLESDGKLHDCVIVTSLPLVDQALLDALKTWRVEPPKFMGRSVSMPYLVPYKIQLQ